MLGSLFGVDWKKSAAHRLLLSRFLHPQDPQEFADKDYWQNALRESPEKALKRFLDEGLLEPTGPEGVLGFRYKLTELKKMLKERSLKVSGRKPELVERLVEADPDGVAKLTRGLIVYQCTEEGRTIAQEYLDRVKERKSKAEQQALEALQKGKFKEAAEAVVSFEAEQVFPRGLNIDWDKRDTAEDAEMLAEMFRAEPEILSGISEQAMAPLRVGAGMMYLWGTNKAKGWLPGDLQTGLVMDTDAAARMVYFYALSRTRLKQYRESGVKKVEILTAGDSCEACRKLAGKEFSIDKAPILPYGKCTHEMGCRCDILPKVDI
jgi:hypothetical protein